MALEPYSRLQRRLRSLGLGDDYSDRKRFRLDQTYMEYDIFSLFKINVVNLIQIKASLAKNFHIQPSEIDKMSMWEYEIFIEEMNKQVKEENDKQKDEMDKYHVNDMMKQNNPKNLQKMSQPKIPSFNMKMPKM